MARRKRGREAEEDEPTVDISSLIDVCFLLLIYFIVTSTIADQESDLMLKLPSSSSDSAEKPDIDPAFFHVTAKGEINQIEAGGGSKQVVGAGHTDYKHRKSTDPIMAGLDNQIQSYVGLAGDKAVVKVKADPEAKVQHVVDLFNILAKHGINKITLTKN